MSVTLREAPSAQARGPEATEPDRTALASR